MGGQGQLVVALVGVSLLILAARGSLKTAWSALLSGDTAGKPPVKTGAESVVRCKLPDGSVVNTNNRTDCTMAGGTVLGSANLQDVASPGPGAPGSGVTTQ